MLAVCQGLLWGRAPGRKNSVGTEPRAAGHSTEGCASGLVRGKVGEAAGKRASSLEPVRGGARPKAFTNRGSMTLARPPLSEPQFPRQ